MASEAECYTIGYMIRGYHGYKDVSPQLQGCLVELHWKSAVPLPC